MLSEPEPYGLNESGEKEDAFFHEPLLDNPKANLAADRMVISQAVKRGMPLKKAVALFAGKEMIAWLKDQGVKY